MSVKHKDLKKVVKELEGAVKAHGKQAKTIDQHIKDMGSGLKRSAPFKLREVSSPMKCWKTHKKVGMKKSPSGKRNADGTIKMVNDCKPK